MLLTIPLDLWQDIFSFLSLKSRYTDELGTVCKSFRECILKVGLSVSVDILYHPISSVSSVPASNDNSSHLRSYFCNIRCLISPPPNPFRYPHWPTDRTVSTCGDVWSSSDVHCSIDVHEEHLATLQNQLEKKDTFIATLRLYIQEFLGGTTLTSCIVRGPETFPFASQLDLRQYVQRRSKRGAHACSDAVTNSQVKPLVTDSWLTVTSINTFVSMLQPLPNLQNLTLLFDVPPCETNVNDKFREVLAGCCSAQRGLNALSLSYLDYDTSAYIMKHKSSLDFFASVLQSVPSVQHLSLGPVASAQHVAPLLQAAMGRTPKSLGIPLQDMSEYLQLMSTQKDIFVAMCSSIRCLVISGYDIEILTFPYICHLIRFFVNITSLRRLVFDMEGDYDDPSEVDALAYIVAAAKLATTENRRRTQLEVFLDFEM